MSLRKFAADYLFDGYKLLRDVTLITNDQGTIEALVPLSEAGSDIEIFNGVLCPGFINCHCHLELSHLKNVIPPLTGLIRFLISVVQKRAYADKIIQEAIINAEQEMYQHGIVAIADICNTSDTIGVKAKSHIRWHNFIEVLSFADEQTDARLAHYHNILHQYQQQLSIKYRSVLTPHAPYTASPKTFAYINNATKNQLISIHNQENPAENELYKTGGGDFLQLFRLFGMERSPFPVTGKSSIQSYLPYFNNGQTIFLVHNTYMSEEDIAYANQYAMLNDLKLVYCLCANANAYIENTTPPIDLFIRNNCHIVLGTDSYSSNWQLNIEKELETMLNTPYFQTMPYLKAFETALKWATINGAIALEMDDQLGSFEKGKQPGIVLIGNIEERDLLATRIL